MKQLRYLALSVWVFIAGIGCNKNDNTPPEIINVIPAMEETTVDNQVRFTCTVNDDDMSKLTFNWESSCGGLLGETTKQYVDWKAPSEAGDCSLKVTVSDGDYTVDHSFTVKVTQPEEPKPPLIGVYYYPWYGGNDFHGRQYLREHLVPVQLPELGEYNDRDQQIIGKHLEWSEYAGIGLWVSSWWGPGKMTDVTLKDYILKHSDLNDMKIALFYETSNRIPDFTDTKNVVSDIKYMAETYFAHPNYYKINDKPVLFIYLTRVLSRNGILDEVTDMMRDAATEAGFEIFLVGDQVFGQPPSSADQMALLDAVTNYDVYGSSGGKMYATQEKVDNYYQAQAGWRSMAHQVGTSFIPASAPGYNDTGVRDGHLPLSRKLSENDEFGSLFEAMVNEAVTLVDAETDNLFMITSWNEWHEDTQIEPVAVAAPTNKDDSGAEQKYTAGLEYEGYGLRYLDILRELVGK
jgi:hypothetical protein